MNQAEAYNFKWCDRDKFLAASEGLLFDRDAEGKCIVCEDAMSFVELAEQGEIIVLTVGGKPISYIENFEEKQIEM